MNKFKHAAAALAVLGVSSLAMAETSAADTAFTTFMSTLQTDITAKVTAMLPILGAIAGVALIIFLALYVYRKVKTFMGR